MMTPGDLGTVYKTAQGPMLEHHLIQAVAGDYTGLDNVLSELGVDAATRQRWFQSMATFPGGAGGAAVEHFLEQLEALTASESDNEEPVSSSEGISVEEPVSDGEHGMDEEPGFEESLRAAEERAMRPYLHEGNASSEEGPTVDGRYMEVEKEIGDSDFDDSEAPEVPVETPDTDTGVFDCKLRTGPICINSDSE